MGYRSKAVWDFMSRENFEGDPKVLLKAKIEEDLTTLQELGGYSNNEEKLKLLGSLRSLNEPLYQPLTEGQSGFNNGDRIIINSLHSKQRQLFTWAHEIVHTYFNSSGGVTVVTQHDEYHFSGEDVEEESLCDYGASIILFREHIPETFTCDSLLRLSRASGTSLEATARAMLHHFNSSHGVIVWQRKGKKGENPNQASLFGEAITYPYRVLYAVGNGAFIPQNKSVNSGDAIDICEAEGCSQGEIVLHLSNTETILYTENITLSNSRILTLFKVSN